MSRELTVSKTMQDVNYTVLAGTTVLTDLIEKCPPAEACRDAFERMSKATVAMCQTTTGFGSQVKFNKEIKDDSPMTPQGAQFPPQPQVYSRVRPPPAFDYNLKDLFAENHSPPTGPIFGPGRGWHFPPTTTAYPGSTSTAGSMPAPATTASLPTKYDPRLFAPNNGAGPRTTVSDLSTSIGSNNTSSTNTSTGYEFANPDPNMDLMQNPDFDFLLQGDYGPGGTNNAYANLGFEGGQHDFDDGSNMPDLFGGFFFGGPQGGDGPMGFAPQGMEGLQFGATGGEPGSDGGSGWG